MGLFQMMTTSSKSEMARRAVIDSATGPVLYCKWYLPLIQECFLIGPLESVRGGRGEIPFYFAPLLCDLCFSLAGADCFLLWSCA